MDCNNNQKPSISIRLVKDTDVETIARIYSYYVLNEVCTFEEIVPSVDEMNKRRLDVISKGLPYYVATIPSPSASSNDNQQDGASSPSTDEIVIGYAYVSTFRTRSAYRYSLENSIYIDHTYRKLGVGSILLKSLIDRCRELGYRQLIAVIGGSDNIGSIKLHEKHGFTGLSVLKSIAYKFEKWVDTVTLQLDLDPSNDPPKF
eukprot:gene7806-9609_t